MKICSKCSRRYPDETLNFCLEDGEWLSDERPSDGQATAILKPEAPTLLTGAAAEPVAASARAGAPKKNLLIAVAAAALAVCVLAAGAYFYFGRTARQITSIAVMPFTNETGNADVDFLSDGVTETLINSLSQIPNLSVKARSSVLRYKGTQSDPSAVGRDLGVQAVLIGRITQRADRLAANWELVDAKTEEHLAGGDYDGKLSELSNVQRDLVRTVSAGLNARLTETQGQKVEKSVPENSEAFRLYLQGRYYWYRFPDKDFAKSREYYEQAIVADPNYAAAYAGLSEYYGFGAANGFLRPDDATWEKSDKAAMRALAIDPSSPDAHNAAAGIKQFSGDLDGAERELRDSIEANPKHAELMVHYAVFLTQQNRTDDAVRWFRSALELEPSSVTFNRGLGRTLYYARRFDEAIEQFKKTLAIDGRDAATHEKLGDAYEQKGNEKDAITEWAAALSESGKADVADEVLQSFEHSGYRKSVKILWQRNLDELNRRVSSGEYIPAMTLAEAYYRVGNLGKTFDWLRLAVGERNQFKYLARFDPVWDGLRPDPRFGQIIEGIDRAYAK